MNLLNRTDDSNKPPSRLLALCLFFSLLLHLLVVIALHFGDFTSDNLAQLRQKPTIVRLVDKPKQETKQPQLTEKDKEYDIDQKVAQPSSEAPEKSSYLAEANQKVEKETAPKGEDFRDKAPVQPARPASRTAAQQPAKKSTARSEQVTQQPKAQTELPRQQTGQLPATQHQETKGEPQQFPSIDQLTQLTPELTSRIIRGEQAAQEQIRRRKNIETGDTVWLNLQRGLLISFFRRFHNQIEGVWNYPREAIERGMQGTLLLKITVDKDGELIDVELVESSGSDILDFEAIQAVYRAAPFGPLGKHYQYPDLKIMAHFQYHLSGKFIYGERR